MLLPRIRSELSLYMFIRTVEKGGQIVDMFIRAVQTSSMASSLNRCLTAWTAASIPATWSWFEPAASPLSTNNIAFASIRLHTHLSA